MESKLEPWLITRWIRMKLIEIQKSIESEDTEFEKFENETEQYIITEKVLPLIEILKDLCDDITFEIIEKKKK